VSSYRDIVLRDRALALWRLGEAVGATSVTDETGSFPMTANGAPTLGQTGALQYDDVTYALFDGVDDAFKTQFPDFRFLVGTGSFSAEFFFKTTSAVNGTLFHAAWVNGASPNIRIRHVGGIVVLSIRDLSGALVANVSSTGPALNDGNYHHVVGVIQRGATGDKLLIYIDGVLNNTSASFGPGWSLSPSLYSLSSTYHYIGIGASYSLSGGSANFFPGTIGDVAWYPYALSAEQVSSHYTAKGLTNYELLLKDRAPEFITLLDVDVEEDVTDDWTRVATDSTDPPTTLGYGEFESVITPDSVSLITAAPTEGSDRILIVRVAMPNTVTVTSITFGGAALTKHDFYDAHGLRVELWYLTNPGDPDGSRALVVTASGALYHAVSWEFFSGVKLSAPFGSVYKTGNASAAFYTLGITHAATTVGETHLFVSSATHSALELGQGSIPIMPLARNVMVQDNAAVYAQANDTEPGSTTSTAYSKGANGAIGFGAAIWMMVVLKPRQSPVYSRPFDEIDGSDQVPGGTFTELIGVNEDGVELQQSIYSRLQDIEGTPLSYFYDRTNKVLYVHTSTSGSPEGFILYAAKRRLRIGSLQTNFPDQPMYYPILAGESIPEFKDDATNSVAASVPIQSATVQFSNSDARFDALIKKWLWRNRKVTMLHGGNFSTGKQLTYAEYEPVGSLFINDASAGDENFYLKLRPSSSPDRALPNETFLDAFPSTIDLFVDQTLRQQYMGVVLGRCYDVPLVYTYTSSGERFVAGYGSDVPIVTQMRAIDRVTGVKTVLVPVTDYVVNSMQDIRIFGYSHEIYDFYADLEESDASTSGKFGSMTKKILLLGEVEESSMDLNSFAEADIDAPFVLGIYIPGGPFPTMMTQQIISELCASVMGRVYLDVDGFWRAKIWDPSIDPEAVPHFNADEDFSRWEPIAKLESIVKGVRIRHSFHVGRQTSREYFDNDLEVEYRQKTRDNLIIKTALTNAEDANLICHRYMAKLAQLTTVVSVTERSAQMMGMSVWDKFLLTRNRAPSETGSFSYEPFELLQLVKKYAPRANVEALIGDISGLRAQLRRWAPDTVVNDYSASTPEEQKNFAYWADVDGLVEGDPLKTSYWW
jgi:hypothetical protein